MKPSYVYNAFYRETLGDRVEVLLDLGFGRCVPMVFELCDIAAVPGKNISGWIDTWMRQDRHITVESIRTQEGYAAHIYRGPECLNVTLRDAGMAVSA